MFSLTLQEFQTLAKKGNLIPLYAEIPADLDTPVSAFLKIRSGKYDFLLESATGGEKWGQYSFLGTNPRMVLKVRNDQLTLLSGKKKTVQTISGDPLSAVKEVMKPFKPVEVPGLPRFFGGAVGFLSYDVVRSFEKIKEASLDDLGVEEAFFVIADTLLMFDNFKQTIKIVVNIYLDGTSVKGLYQKACVKIETLVRQLRKPIPSVSKKKKTTPETPRVRHTEKEFMGMVEKAREYIKAGDVFQVVLSTRYEAKTDIDPFELYRVLRRLNPSPYLYFLHFDDLAVVGASPEVMVRLEGKRAELRPIAGTRRRGYTEKEDLELEEELREDPKERAEHIMLVDLGRNDLGRVCEIGSVTVDELEIVERYSHVMHLVSHVSGMLKKGRDAYDLIRATFPAGTLTGAPKIRAMEIIEELEGLRRGVYGGCVGYIGFNGNCDTAIAIRTAFFKGKKVYVQAGAGIVFNSDARLEYKECQNKARGVLKALENVYGRTLCSPVMGQY
ncbi:MAG TPA: anthranilate synthase component I [Deltaproteobacteria bacterium]|nr:MAG: anthranilate synthase component I [Deltaproteobacteria bacterium GWA2_45_12]HBF12491.1 anthranilate synthase component I [Deltaproteobacteria bacterium]